MTSTSARRDDAPALAASTSTSIVIAATFAAQPVREVVTRLLGLVGIDATIEFAPHFQLTPQLLDPSSPLSRNHGGVNVLLVRLSVSPVVEDRTHDSADELLVDQLGEATHVCAGEASASWIVVSCPPPSRLIADPDQADRWRRAEERLMRALTAIPSLQAVRADDVLRSYSVRAYEDEYGDALADLAYTPAFVAALGTTIARRVHAWVVPPRKVIVLDCDHTLWSGICAEDGVNGVLIDAGRHRLQTFLRARKNAGMLLCLASKNEEADVWDVFAHHPGMVLRRDDIAAARIGWTPKSQSIRALAGDLQLGLDTFVFIDDDPRERAEVEDTLPEVLTVPSHADPLDTCAMLENLWALDQVAVTDDDRQRTARYQQSRDRDGIRETTATVEDFVRLLDLRVSIARAADEHLARIAQLTWRVTQCNCTLKRSSEPELRQLQAHDDREVLAVHASDRFGDYGLVGALVTHLEGDVLEVDTFLLSCRALGREIERRMIEELEARARARDMRAIRLRFVPGPRNGVARAFLDRLGPPWTRRDDDGGVVSVYTCPLARPVSQ